MHEEISVLIPTSPIRSHPATAIIEETMESIRYHLPNSHIFIMADGVREEQADRKADYMDYLGRLAAKCLFEFNDIRIIPFFEFTHQALMTMRTLPMVTTPLILFVEADTPLVDKPIDWDMLKNAIMSGATNHIRLHYDERIHPEHEHMMCGKLTDNLIKCIQWHQRPHLAKTTFYKGVLYANFTENSRTFIEDVVYSPVSYAPWEDYRLTVYDPEGTGRNMKRSRDLNGRAGEQKYPMIFR